MTEAHKTGDLGELVCSNSLRSNDLYTAPGLLKKELSLAASLIMEAAESSIVPAGSALAVEDGFKLSDAPFRQYSRGLVPRNV